MQCREPLKKGRHAKTEAELQHDLYFRACAGCLRPIARCALTTVVAPMGYGKTTAINWFLAEKTKGGKAVAIRMSIYSGSIPILWRSAQDAFRYAGLSLLDAFDFPGDEASAGRVMEELCRTLSSGKTSYYLFLDDFHLLRDERAVRFICRISARLPENAHLIVASRDRFLPAGEIVRLGRNLNQIGMEQLRLNHTELAIYTHKCGAALSRAAAGKSVPLERGLVLGHLSESARAF